MPEHTENKSTPKNDSFEQTLAAQVARELLTEQRRNRRWGIFFKFLLALYVLGFFLVYLGDRMDLEPASIRGKPHTALIEINGAIGAETTASADNIVSGLRAAFKDKNTAGIILRINSPGGSPVQAGYVNDEIYRLREKHPDIPVHAVISDLCTSGGYYIASAAETIYADKASLVGSIGVVMSGFGFVDALEKLGVERRLRAAGDNKGFLDPFSPLKEEEIAHLDNMLDDIYRQFKAVVRKGRGDRLGEDERIFSGLIWTGEQALELGLVDALASSSFVAREVIGAEDIVDFTYQPGYLDRFTKRLGSALAESFYMNKLIPLIQ